VRNVMFALAMLALTTTTASAQLFGGGLSQDPRNPSVYYNPYQPTAPINCAKIAPEVREYARGCAPVKQLRKKGTR